MNIFFIAAGGALGAALRYSVAGFTHKFISGVFPWGTFVVNLSGCLLMGFLWGVSENTIVSSNFKPFLLIGVLGGYTTFSSFGLESFHLFRDGEIKLALFNIFLSNIGCLLMVLAGFVISEYLYKLR